MGLAREIGIGLATRVESYGRRRGLIHAFFVHDSVFADGRWVSVLAWTPRHLRFHKQNAARRDELIDQSGVGVFISVGVVRERLGLESLFDLFITGVLGETQSFQRG